MHRKRTLALLFLLLASLAAAGCGGGGAEVRATSTSTTIGQELVDLQKARDMGIISEDEYQDAKEKVLDRQ